MREKLISFLPDQFPEPDAFFVELTGVTYPDPRYRIDRDRSPVLPPSARHPFARARFALHPAGQPALPGGAGPGASGPLAVRAGHGGRSGRRRGTFPLAAHAGVCRPLRRNALPLSASRRLETARLLLRGTALPVREIAFRLCFSDEHYFSSLFRRKTGQTPSAYRRDPDRKIL